MRAWPEVLGCRQSRPPTKSPGGVSRSAVSTTTAPCCAARPDHVVEPLRRPAALEDQLGQGRQRRQSAGGQRVVVGHDRDRRARSGGGRQPAQQLVDAGVDLAQGAAHHLRAGRVLHRAGTRAHHRQEDVVAPYGDRHQPHRRARVEQRQGVRELVAQQARRRGARHREITDLQHDPVGQEPGEHRHVSLGRRHARADPGRDGVAEGEVGAGRLRRSGRGRGRRGGRGRRRLRLGRGAPDKEGAGQHGQAPEQQRHRTLLPAARPGTRLRAGGRADG